MMAAAHIAAALPLVLAGEPASAEDILRQMFPRPDDFRVQMISRTSGEDAWPFSVDAGMLACVWSLGQRAAFFIEDAPPAPGRRQLLLSANPIVLLWGNKSRDLLAEGLSDEELVRRTGPYIAMANRLCDQPPGAVLEDGAL